MSGKSRNDSERNQTSPSNKKGTQQSPSLQQKFNLSRPENRSSDALIQNFQEGSLIPNFLEQLVMQAISNIFSDPVNAQIIFDHIAQTALQSPHFKNNLHNCFQSRDVSTHEIIRPCDLPQVTGLSRTTIHRLRKANQFVPHIQLSSGAIGFSRELIQEWLKSREDK